jgi:nucleotide-binding universal stress UspA family protein
MATISEDRLYTSILAATDGTDIAARAAEHAAFLARTLGARLTFVTVTDRPPTFAAPEIGWSVSPSVYEDIRKANAQTSRKILDAAVKASGLAADGLHIEDQAPFEGILVAAETTHADLIVIGSHGHRGLERLILGSQAQKVLSLAKVPVLVVKP